MSRYEVWQSPGGRCWEGTDQEEAVLAALHMRRPGTITEVAEIYGPDGRLHLRRIARYDGRVRADRLR
jgi:hypothetical protein